MLFLMALLLTLIVVKLVIPIANPMVKKGIDFAIGIVLILWVLTAYGVIGTAFHGPVIQIGR